MEKIVINRKVTTPKQEFITDCLISDVTESSVTITSKVELTKEQTWHIRRNIENNVLADQALSLISSSKNGDTYSYTFELPQRNPIYIEEVIEGETGETETYYILAFSSPHNILPEDFGTNSGMTLSFTLDDGTIQKITHLYSVFKDADAPIEDTTDYDPSRLNLYRLIVPLSENEWVTGSTYTNKAISFPYTEFFNDTDFWNRVSIASYTDALVIPITLEKDYADGLLQEETVNNQFVDIVKEEVVPSVLNGEKVVIKPISGNLDNADDSGHVSGIMEVRLTPIFRVHSGDSWSIDETKAWTNYEVNDRFSYQDVSGSTLADLNFTDDDIAFQKEKIAKSFLRLSLYNSRAVGEQQLLWYSTIFMDTNDIYDQYVKLAPEKAKMAPNDDTYIAKKIKCEFTFTDRYDDKHSSEGYYIYTFPEYIGPYLSGTTVYLRVDFNHAGYGKTIPLIVPSATLAGSTVDEGAALKATKVKEWFNHAYIPIELMKNGTEKDYGWYFRRDAHDPWSVFIDQEVTENGGYLNFNLFETLLYLSEKTHDFNRGIMSIEKN